MASSKLMILSVALLLIALVSAQTKCKKTSDCPPCAEGDPVCVGGFCFCTVPPTMFVASAVDYTPCKTDQDCAAACSPSCGFSCANGICGCSC